MKHFNDFPEKDLISFIKSRKMNSAAVLILDVVSPFNRIISAMITITSPMLEIFIAPEKIVSGISLLEDRNRIRHLKKKLLEEN